MYYFWVDPFLFSKSTEYYFQIFIKFFFIFSQHSSATLEVLENTCHSIYLHMLFLNLWRLWAVRRQRDIGVFFGQQGLLSKSTKFTVTFSLHIFSGFYHFCSVLPKCECWDERFQNGLPILIHIIGNKKYNPNEFYFQLAEFFFSIESPIKIKS